MPKAPAPKPKKLASAADLNTQQRNNNVSADNLESGVITTADGAEENAIAERTVLGSDGAHKIKFKRAKKLHRLASSQYMRHMNETAPGKFANWSRAEIIELLVSKPHYEELRNESTLETSVLRDLAESLYTAKAAPPKPVLPSFFEIVKQNISARRIQNTWIIYQEIKRFDREEQENNVLSNRIATIEDGADENIGADALLYMSMANMNDPSGGQDIESAPQRGDGKDDEESKGAPRRLNILDVPWTPPDVEKAKKYADYVQPRRGGKGGEVFNFYTATTGRHCFLGGLGEQFDMWEEGKVSEFGLYGPGVTNYFKFMKWCFWLFVILTIIALPAIILNETGDNQGNSGLKSIARTTIGNLVSTEANSTIHIHIPGCENYNLFDISCYFNEDGLAIFYSSLDIVVTAAIFIGFLWLQYFERQEEQIMDKSTVKASMYTIAVTHLPPDITEAELVTHFEKFFANRKKSSTELIASIDLAYDNIDEIKTCKRRGAIIKEKVHEAHNHRRKCTQLRENSRSNPEDIEAQVKKERDRFLTKMSRMNDQLKELDQKLQKLSDKTPNAVYAFVTFNKTSDRDQVLDIYNNISLTTYLCGGGKYKIRNEFPRVKPAPEPSVILWENLSHSNWSRFKRRALAFVCSLLLIVITLIMVFSSKYLEQTATNNGSSSSELCPEGFSTWDDQAQQEYVEENSAQLQCYCNQFSTLKQAGEKLCQNYLRKNVQAQILIFFASMVVLLVNQLIEKSITLFSEYEKHHTSDGQGMSIFTRVFILKFINTAAVFLINNNNVILKTIFGLEDAGSNAQFSPNWFNQIGVSIVLVQLGDVVNAHGNRVYNYFKFNWSKNRLVKNPKLALTQDELNKQFVGPEFEFALNYAQMISTFFVCLTFSTGIPILYPIAAFNFFVYYFAEKYCFISIYKVPPHFNTLVGKRATALVPIAILLHLAMSVWVLSNSQLFSTTTEDNNSGAVDDEILGSTISDKITSKATFPLFVTFCVLVALRVLVFFGWSFFKACGKSLKFMFSCINPERLAMRKAAKDKTRAVGAKAVITYTRAIQRNLIKGLSTYNILLNPTYKEAFGITWRFAVDHNKVRDLRGVKMKAQAGADEDDAAKVDELQRNRNQQLSRKRSGRPVGGANRNRSFYNSFFDAPSSNNLHANNQATDELNTPVASNPPLGVPAPVVTTTRPTAVTVLPAPQVNTTPVVVNANAQATQLRPVAATVVIPQRNSGNGNNGPRPNNGNMPMAVAQAYPMYAQPRGNGQGQGRGPPPGQQPGPQQQPYYVDTYGRPMSPPPGQMAPPRGVDQSDPYYQQQVLVQQQQQQLAYYNNMAQRQQYPQQMQQQQMYVQRGPPPQQQQYPPQYYQQQGQPRPRGY